MIARERPYTIDLNRDPTDDRWDGALTYGDKNADTIVATLNRGSEAATLESPTAMLYGVRNDGTTAFRAATVSENIVTAEMDYTFYAIPGRLLLLLKITEGTTVTNTPLRIAAYVKDGETEELVSTGEQFSLAEIQAAVEACEAATTAAEQAITDAGTATQAANTAAGNADTKAGLANDAALTISGMTVEAQTLDPEEEATASVSDVSGHKHIAFGIPQGIQGERGYLPWYGTAITGNSAVPTAYATGLELVQAGDIYVYTGTDTANAGNEYVCTFGGNAATALWVYLRNSRGVPGAGNVSYVDEVAPDGDGNVALGSIRYSAAQTLTTEQKVQARSNAGAQAQIGVTGIAKFDGSGGALAAVAGTDYRAAQVETTATIAASSWTGSAAPYTQVVAITGLLETSTGVEAGLSSAATQAQREAARAALIVATAYDDGEMTFVADGELPEIDLPVAVWRDV